MVRKVKDFLFYLVSIAFILCYRDRVEGFKKWSNLIEDIKEK